MLPKPSVGFTIPSIHDESKLDCRVFHPECLSAQSSHAPRWGRHVAIVAHPYAPLGGSYDDHIVDLVAATLLKLGFLVATFNFRGAHGSSGNGRTSWNSRPERADYMSVVGFMAYYVHYLDIPGRINAKQGDHPVFLMAGYSYGAMIVTKIPHLDSILAKFYSPVLHTAAADIRLRAQHLAEEQSQIALSPSSPRKSMGRRIGGEDENLRKSHEVRRSTSHEREEKICKGVKDILRRSRIVRRIQRHRAHPHEEEKEQETECMEHIDELPNFRPAYIAVSPPFGIVTNFATMSFSNPFGSLSRKKAPSHTPISPSSEHSDGEDEKNEEKLARNPSIVIYGTTDGFLQLRKIEEWIETLRGYKGSQLQVGKITGSGHFYAEGNAMHILRDAVEEFGTEILKETTASQPPDNNTPGKPVAQHPES